MTEVKLRHFAAADRPWLVGQHRVLYGRDDGFDDTFGDLVDRILIDFAAHHDPDRERGWIVERDGNRLGSIFCVDAGQDGGDIAKLRLFLLLPQARGLGLGKRMLRACMLFARRAGYTGMRLSTHESHRAACALYAASGWQLRESRPVHSFGVDLVEQSWQIDL